MDHLEFIDRYLNNNVEVSRGTPEHEILRDIKFIEEEIRLFRNEEYLAVSMRQSRLREQARREYRSLKQVYEVLKKKIAGELNIEAQSACIRSVIHSAEQIQESELKKLRNLNEEIEKLEEEKNDLAEETLGKHRERRRVATCIPITGIKNLYTDRKETDHE